MKVIRKDKTPIQLSEIGYGDTFEKPEDAYCTNTDAIFLKLDTGACDDNNYIECAHLEHGTVYTFQKNTRVIPVMVEVKVI